jgi:RNA polymerase sigma factor (sigma-70 family)
VTNSKTSPPAGLAVPESVWKHYDLHRRFLEEKIIAPILRGNNIRDIEPQDICHDAFQKFIVYQQQHHINNELAFLIATAKNEALNAVKKRREPALEIDCPDPHDVASAVGTRLDAKSMKQELMQQLCNLFPKHALRDYKIIIYRWCFDMRYKDIAKQMGITQNIVLDTLKRKFADTIAPILQKKFPNQ